MLNDKPPSIFGTPPQKINWFPVNVGDLAIMRSYPSDYEPDRRYLIRIVSTENKQKIYYRCITVSTYYPDHIGQCFIGDTDSVIVVPKHYAVNDFPDEWLTELFQNVSTTDVEQLKEIKSS